MPWDPAVLRKYNTTGHFRLLNQVRSELKGNPLIRPKDGETVGAANRSRSLTRAIEGRSQSGGRSRRGGSGGRSVSAPEPVSTDADMAAFVPVAVLPMIPGLDDMADPLDGESIDDREPQDPGSASFRDRLNAIEMR